MHDIGQAFLTAVRLIRSFDPELIGIVTLSLRVSLSAAVIAMVVGAPLGGALAVSRFRGFFFSSRRRHTRCSRDWSSDVCSSDLVPSATGLGTVAIDPEETASDQRPRSCSTDQSPPYRSEERRVGKECRSRWS